MSSSSSTLRHASNAPLPFSDEQRVLGTPLPDAEYQDYSDVKRAYNDHAFNRGYAVVLADSKGLERPNKLGRRVVFRCDRWGKPTAKNKGKDVHTSRKRANTGSRKCNCPFMVEAQEYASDGVWRGRIVNNLHNHTPSAEPTSHPELRRMNIDQKARDLVRTLSNRGNSVASIREHLRTELDIIVTDNDIYNMRESVRNAELGGLTAVQWLIDTLQEREFFTRWDVAIDNPNRVTRLFFAHPESIKLIRQHPDVLLLDCTYKTNRYNMPLLNICGSTGNNMTPQYALAFLSGEKQEDYTWALKCWTEMAVEHIIPPPKCFVTDRELALLSTLDDLFPSADHILCRWHVNMNVVAKTKRYFKTQESFQAFYEAWGAVINAETAEDYDTNLIKLREHHTTAVKYVEKTWLVWREKIVIYWVNKACHFGNITTSRNESSHAAIKAYLRNSRGDHKHFFDAVCIFWKDQHTKIRERTDAAKVKPRTSTNIMFFRDILPYVHSYALVQINAEKAKLPLKASEPPIYPCKCSIRASRGLPCFHEIWEKQRNPGFLTMGDIDPHWYYDRGIVMPQSNRRILLDPLVVKGKGRPKGSKGKKNNLPHTKGHGESSTRRDPSLFEHTAIELPSSTAPARVQTSGPAQALFSGGNTSNSDAWTESAIQRVAAENAGLSTTGMAILRGARSRWDVDDNSQSDLSTTALAILRGAGDEDDPYEAGTLRERAYMRSINPERLAQAELDELDEAGERDGDLLDNANPPGTPQKNHTPDPPAGSQPMDLPIRSSPMRPYSPGVLVAGSSKAYPMEIIDSDSDDDVGSARTTKNSAVSGDPNIKAEPWDDDGFVDIDEYLNATESQQRKIALALDSQASTTRELMAMDFGKVGSESE